MAPHVVDRPLAIVRAPEGVGGETFFQKHIASTIKQSPLRHVVDAKEHDVIAVEKLDDLIALVQSGALEVHTRGSRLGRLEVCDRIVFDLDPGEGVSWKTIVAAAQETRDRLKAEKLKSFVKLSGGKGVHVVVPIDGADWDTTKAFAARIANAMAADAPQRYLAKMTKALRHNKIFIDYFRNSREATSVAAYSTRARPGAPVSMPLSWEALLAHHRRQSVHRAQCEEAVARRCVGGDGQGEAEAAGAAEAAALIALCCVIPDRRAAASPESRPPALGLWIPGSELRSARNDRLSALRPFRQPLEASASPRGCDGTAACRWCRSPSAGRRIGLDRRACRFSRSPQAGPAAA